MVKYIFQRMMYMIMVFFNECCRTGTPLLEERIPGHLVRCHLCGGDKHGA